MRKSVKSSDLERCKKELKIARLPWIKPRLRKHSSKLSWILELKNRKSRESAERSSKSLKMIARGSLPPTTPRWRLMQMLNANYSSKTRLDRLPPKRRRSDKTLLASKPLASISRIFTPRWIKTKFKDRTTSIKLSSKARRTAYLSTKRETESRWLRLRSSQTSRPSVSAISTLKSLSRKRPLSDDNIKQARCLKTREIIQIIQLT